MRFRVKTPGEPSSNPPSGLMSLFVADLGKATTSCSPGGLRVQEALGKCVCEIDFQTCQRQGFVTQEQHLQGGHGRRLVERPTLSEEGQVRQEKSKSQRIQWQASEKDTRQGRG